MAPPVSRSPGWVEAIKMAVESTLAEVHTCLPGRIESYDKDTQLADVRITTKKKTPLEDGDTLVEEFPVVPGVRVEFSQSADFFMSFPLAAGDFVWLHIVEQSVDAWFTNGGVGVADPITRRFDLSDAWAVPARDPQAPLAETENDAIVIGGKGSAPRAYFTDSIIALGEKAPSEFIALATKTKNELDALRNTVNSFVSTYNSHTHPYVDTPAGAAVTSPTTSTGTPPAVVGSVAATKVKAV